MKKIAILVLVAIIPGFIMAQDVIDNLIQKYQAKDGFTTVIINKDLFEMIAAIDDDEDLAKMKGMIENVRIIAMEGNSDNSINFYKEIIDQVNVNSYKELMKVKQSNEDVVFYAKYNNNIIEELLLIAGGADDNAVISIKGKISLKDMAQLSKSVHINGFEHMDKLKDIQLVFKKNVSEHNRLFDSIAEKDILEALEAKGVSLKKENIRMKSHIKILGEHDVLIHLKEGAELNIKVNVEDEGK